MNRDYRQLRWQCQIGNGELETASCKRRVRSGELETLRRESFLPATRLATSIYIWIYTIYSVDFYRVASTVNAQCSSTLAVTFRMVPSSWTAIAVFTLLNEFRSHTSWAFHHHWPNVAPRIVVDYSGSLWITVDRCGSLGESLIEGGSMKEAQWERPIEAQWERLIERSLCETADQPTVIWRIQQRVWYLQDTALILADRPIVPCTLSLSLSSGSQK